VKTPIASFLSAAIWSLCLQGASGLSALPTPPSAPPRNAASAKATPKTTAKKKSVSRAAVAKRASRPAATNRAAVKTNAARRVLPAFPTPPKRIAPPSTNRAGKPSSPARTAAPPARRAPALPAFPQLPTPPRPQTPAGGPRPPAAPPTSAAGGPPIQPVSTNYSGLPPTAILEGGTIDFPAAPLDQVLEFYAELTGRTVLRPAALPAAQITLRTQGPLTKEEAVQALDTVLALNGITMINVGEKFVTAVPTTQALQEGAAFTKKDASQLPEAGQFVTKTVQLKHILPSDAVQILQSFSKIQNGLLPIDNAQTLVIRDYAANVKRMMEILEKIDVEEEQDYQLAVIPIKYGKVTDIYGTMNSLITGHEPRRGGALLVRRKVRHRLALRRPQFLLLRQPLRRLRRLRRGPLPAVFRRRFPHPTTPQRNSLGHRDEQLNLRPTPPPDRKPRLRSTGKSGTARRRADRP